MCSCRQKFRDCTSNSRGQTPNSTAAWRKMRACAVLSRVLENLPCGVLVVSATGQTQIINPKARRLLQVPADWSPRAGNELPAEFEKAMSEAPVAGDIF